MEKTRLERMVAGHEGYREHVYRCTADKLSIGYGYNLDAGMPEDEAHLLMRFRLAKLDTALGERLPWYKGLSAERKEALLDMAYQMGVDGVLRFRRALAAMEQQEWETAAAEMLDSKWARNDSPSRAIEIARIMRTGKTT